jgi:hypothetical protein
MEQGSSGITLLHCYTERQEKASVIFLGFMVDFGEEGFQFL